jgi:peptidoglycan-associated lipoprotein
MKTVAALYETFRSAPALARIAAGSLLIAGAPLLGCADSTPPAQAPLRPVATATPPPPPQAPAPVRPVNVSNDLRALCNLPTPKEAPKFDFDASDLTATDREVLQGLAKCMTDGPLKGKAVRLVGHADPRGETEYNMALGAKRADGVKSFLSGLGVAETRLHQTSRGELDAKGTDEETWLMDRRVDIEPAP